MIRFNKFLSIIVAFFFLTLVSCDPIGTSINNNQSTTHSVNLRGNGGSPISQYVYVSYGNNMPNANQPTRYGYNFLGYYDSMYLSNGTMYYSSYMQGVRTWDRNSDGTLYALWRLN
jgi:hypothetical protein